MIVIGIDVGVSGALASIDEAGNVVRLVDLPISQSGALKWIRGSAFLIELFAARRGKEPCRAFVEQTGPMPKLGMKAANSKGLTLGSVVAVLEVAEIPVEFVAPARWKRALGLLSPGADDAAKKAASLSRARLLFPRASLERQKDHNRAESLLLAHFGQRYVLGHAAPETSAAASAAMSEFDLVGGGKAA